MKKLTSVLALTACALSISATAFAAISPEEAKAIAQKEVPATSTFLRIETEVNKYAPYYEVNFYDSTTHTEYEIDVLQKTGAVRKYSMEKKTVLGSPKIVLSANDIQAQVSKEYPGAVIRKIDLEIDNGLYEYEAKFRLPGAIGEVNYNAETGEVLEIELKYQY